MLRAHLSSFCESIMNANSLLTLIMTRSDHLLTAWCILGVAGLALLAVVAALPTAHTSAAVGRLMALGWLLFAATHFLSMHWILKQWSALALALQESAGYKIATEGVKTEIASVITVPELAWVLPFHLAYDAFVVIGLWWLTRPQPQPPR